MSILCAPRELLPASCRDGADIVARLRDRQRTASILGFVYARSPGGLVQSGRGRVTVFDEMALNIRRRRLHPGRHAVRRRVRRHAADLLHARPRSHFQVAGIGVRLASHDWLFFSPDDVPPAALPGSGGLRL